jgi:hypothetical protein
VEPALAHPARQSGGFEVPIILAIPLSLELQIQNRAAINILH